MNKKEKLYREIKKFTKWADQCQPTWSEERDNGEWELGYPHFEELCGAAEVVVNEYPCSEADETLIHALLFVIARDNECEELVEEKLVLHRDWFELLAKKSIGSKYVNAEWQFAKHLGDCEGCDPELLFLFIKSEYEYTSRMALWTMAELKPECAERYAFEFWDRGKYPAGSSEDEYQKIMALHVLAKLNSPKLEAYLERAMQSDYKCLRKNAEELSAKYN